MKGILKKLINLHPIEQTKPKSLLGEAIFLGVFFVLPYKLILSPISLGLLFLWHVMVAERKEPLKSNFNLHRDLIGFYVFFLVQVVSVIYSASLNESSERLLTQSPLLIVPLLFATVLPSQELIKKAKKIFILSCVLFCVFSFSTLFYNYVINYEHRLNYNFMQRSMYHFHFPYDVLYINVAFAFLLFDNLRIKPIFKTIITILFFLFIVASGVRIGILIFLSLSVFVTVINFKQMANLKTVILSLLLMVSAIVIINLSDYTKDKILDSFGKIGFGTERYVSEIGEKYHNITLREKLWTTSIEAINEKPIFGYGPKGAQKELNGRYIKKGFKNIIGFNSHNQYLTTLIENGFVGLFVLFSIFLVAFARSIKMKSLSNCIVVLIFAVAFLTESVLVRQKGVVFFSIVISIQIIQYAHWNKTLNKFQNNLI